MFFGERNKDKFAIVTSLVLYAASLLITINLEVVMSASIAINFEMKNMVIGLMVGIGILGSLVVSHQRGRSNCEWLYSDQGEPDGGSIPPLPTKL